MKTFKEFLNETKESLYEMSLAFTDSLNKLAIWVENLTGYNNQYFKLYNNDSYVKATKVARISMLKPNYLVHKNDDGKENWILNNKEKRKLINLLHSKNEEYVILSNWQVIIATYNRDNFHIPFVNLVMRNITFDDYNEKIKTIKGAIPLNQPMPDYMKL